jgi:subtilisin family serine protease
MKKRLSIAGFLVICSQLIGSAAFAIVPNDPFFSGQWDLNQIHAPQAWEKTTGSPSVVVAVIDTGVDIYNDDLKDNIWVNPGEIIGNRRDDDGNGYVDDIHGWNFVASSNDVRPWGDATEVDPYIHGTLVASLIAAKGNNAYGMAGVAWNVKIMPIVALAGDGTGLTTDVASAVYYAADNGASIINLSIEGDTRDPELDTAIAYARSKGVLTVTVAGNAEPTEKDPYAPPKNLGVTPVYPACSAPDGLYGSLTVSATDKNDRKASFANYGSCVDVMAPGVDIFGARPPYTGSILEATTTHFAGGYSGTSVAAPIVSGIAALLKSIHPNWGASELRNRIIASAVPIDAKNVSSLAGKLGSGRVDAAAALDDARFATSTAASLALTVEGTRPGEPTRVRILSGVEILELAPFGFDDQGGAVAAFSDLDGDGTPEVGTVQASGVGDEVAIYGRDGQERTRVKLGASFTDGALIVGVDDGFVVADPNSGRAWGIDRSFAVHPFFPYESVYSGGLDLLAISGAAAFAPRNGGGRLVVSNADGVQLVSAFPFGTAPSGRWSLAKAVQGGSTSLILSGPSGTKEIGANAIGQIGWKDVSFSDLEHMMLTLSDGRPGTATSTRAYDAWPH